MIALGSEGQPLSLRQRQSALDRRQIRLYDVPRAGLSILTPNHPTIQTTIAGIML
jgi:hypothetical protein